MSLLSATDVANCTAACQSLYTDTAIVLRKSAAARDARGGYQHTRPGDFVQVGSPFSCRVEIYTGKRGGIEKETQGRFEEPVDYRLMVPPTVNVTAADYVKVTSASPALTIEVTEVAAPKSHQFELELYGVTRPSA